MVCVDPFGNEGPEAGRKIRYALYIHSRHLFHHRRCSEFGTGYRRGRAPRSKLRSTGLIDRSDMEGGWEE